MRIVIPQRLTMAHGIRGGMETQAQSLAQGLQARGHTIHVLTHPHPEGVSEGYEGGVPVSYIGPGSWRKYETAWWEACYQHITHMHRQQPLDLLLSQSAGGLGYIPRVAGELGIPCVAIMHGSLTGELRNRWRDLRSLRGVYRMIRHLKRLPRLYMLWKKAVPMVAHWIVVSQETASEWQREFAIPSERLHVVPNGIDTSRFRPNAEARRTTRQQLGIAEDVPLLLAMGRFEYEKGFQVAIRAVKQLHPCYPDLRLVLAGDGVYAQTLKQLAETIPGKSVIMPGYVANEELPALLAAADIFLMPTLRDEGLPMSTLEAMAAGLAPIASGAGGMRSVIDHEHNGLLFRMGNVQELTQAIERLIKQPALRTVLASAARETAETRYSRTHMIETTEQILLQAGTQHERELCKQKQPAPQLH
jgi:glycosyltransferase involved in cell wall biosynthesis